MAATTLSLPQMVDLALGTPEVGAVNFNVLHTLLHALLAKLDLTGAKANINEADRAFLLSRQGQDTQDGSDSASGRDSGVGSAPQTPVYHQLIGKVSKLEQQMEIMNSLPANTDLFDQLKSKGEGERARPMSDMWQTMQIQKRVDANEEGIGKLMSLVEDLMSEMQSLKDLSNELREKMKQLEEMNKLDEMNERLNELEKLTSDLNNRFSQYPSVEFFENYVTWPGLEDALKGIRDSMEYTPPERVVIEMTTQTDRVPTPPKAPTPQPRPVSAVSVASSRPMSSRSRTATPGPTAELVELLEKLGRLHNRHDQLEERVDVLEDQMKNKADKTDLDGLGKSDFEIPSDLLDQLRELQDQVARMQKNRDKDSDALTRMQQVILQLQAEVDRIGTAAEQLQRDSASKQKSIEELYGITSNLDERKADKEFVHMEVDVKADKRHLENKVNRSVFDTACEELNRMIKELLDKMFGHEDEWKKALGLLSSDIDGKLDRLEFKPIRDEIERRLKEISRKLNSLDLLGDVGDDDAAGIRKQLLQRFHCISCDRPVDMMPQGPIPSIPASAGLPATRSTRPYTTFELDQIRQSARNSTQPNLEVTDMYATTRSCGGPHTMTFPHRRITRMTHINNLFREEEPPPPPVFTKEELDIQGADGHIYKGRVFDNRLPLIAPAGQPVGQADSPQLIRRAQTSPGGPRPSAAQTATTPRSARPSSARMSRPTSGQLSSRPGSAMSPRRPTEVPTARDDQPVSSQAASERDTQGAPTPPVPTPPPPQGVASSGS